MPLSHTAAAGLRELREQHGVTPTDEDIVALDALGWQVERPAGEDQLELIGMPVMIGGVALWRMTRMGHIWFRECASVWFRDSPEWQETALAFAMAHGRGAEIPGVGRLNMLADRAAAVGAISAWRSRIAATAAELRAAMERLFEDEDATAADECCDYLRRALRRCDVARFPAFAEEALKVLDALTPPETGPTADWERIVGELEAATGIPADYWLTQKSAPALGRAYLRATAICAAGGRAGAPPLKDAVTRALVRFRAEISAIIKRCAPAYSAQPQPAQPAQPPPSPGSAAATAPSGKPQPEWGPDLTLRP